MSDRPAILNHAPPVTPHRRRFQFRLRTLLIGVTLLAVPLGFVGWQAKIVRDRKAACDEIILGGGGVLRADEGPLPWVLTRGHDYSIPFLRRWMGDHAIFWIVYKRGTTVDEIRRLRSLFPEAMLYDDSIVADRLRAINGQRDAKELQEIDARLKALLRQP